MLPLTLINSKKKPLELKNFDAAWNHPDKEQREKWRAAIKKEFHSMIKRRVWRIVKRSDMPEGKRCVKHKWVFLIKRNGIFRARLVACGYSQVPGVDHDEIYAPVVHDVTYRIVILCMMLYGLSAKIVDLETAFPHGDLEGIEIYMDCPDGLE